MRLIGSLSLMRLGLMLAFCCLLPLATVTAQTDKAPKKAAQKVVKEPVMQRVGMFGFAVSFKDSVVCLTEIQTLDSAYIEPAHGFLHDRSLYSLQLQMYLESLGYKNAVCTVLFDKKPHKLNRVMRKVRKKFERDASFRIKEVPVSEFRFKAEEYRPVILEEETTEAAGTTKAAETAKAAETTETPATPATP